MTSNLGAREMSNLAEGGLGFAGKRDSRSSSFEERMERTAVEAARRKFTPEFMNRMDKTVVFKTLLPEHLQTILEIELGMVQKRILAAPTNRKFAFYCTAGAKDFLLREGTNATYGARHLKRAIEKHLVFPLAKLVATAQVDLGDIVQVDCDGGRISFAKEAARITGNSDAHYYGPASAMIAAAMKANASDPSLILFA
jgi:ATP-dependent Clp protease ATP-binding subunit ClpB